MILKNKRIAIIGLGYVGLPLAISFSKKYNVVGFDVNQKRVDDLKKNKDVNNEYNISDLDKSQKKNLFITNIKEDIEKCNIFIITVPTPIKDNNQPDLSFIINATQIVTKFIKKNDIIIYESTVYPGVTENICIPLIEKKTKKILNKDFYCGYSPERINPGDKKNNITSVIKVTSGSNKYSANIIDKLYKSIIKAGTFKVSSIKVAEASKVIENIQRDVNIALANELSIIFNKINIETKEVINAASTKWNYIKYLPGLVGGHCIGIDPYYLDHLAKKNNYKTKIITSARKLNNSIARYIYNQCKKYIKNEFSHLKKINILIMGISYKENSSDLRNSKTIDLINFLINSKYNVEIFEPLLIDQDKNNFKKFNFVNPLKNKYDMIILTVPHNYFMKMGFKKIRSFGKKKFIFFDIKGVFPSKYSSFRL